MESLNNIPVQKHVMHRITIYFDEIVWEIFLLCIFPKGRNFVIIIEQSFSLHVMIPLLCICSKGLLLIIVVDGSTSQVENDMRELLGR
jgi:hypothetical protein